MAKAKGNAVRKIAPRIERTSGAFRDPRTKSELIDRMMSREFSGDIMDLALNRELRMERTRPNVMQLKFGTSGKTFELVIRKPRGPRTGESLKVKGGKKTGSRTANVRRRRSVDDEGEATGNAVH